MSISTSVGIGDCVLLYRANGDIRCALIIQKFEAQEDWPASMNCLFVSTDEADVAELGRKTLVDTAVHVSDKTEGAPFWTRFEEAV